MSPRNGFTGVLTGLLTAWIAVAGAHMTFAAGQTMPSDTATTPTVTLWAFVVDYNNSPVANVEIRYQLPGNRIARSRTGVDGAARLTAAAPGQAIRAEIDDAAWYSPDGIQQGEAGGTPIVFRAFRSSEASMSRDERIALHRERIRALLEQRRRAEAQGASIPGDDDTSTTKPTASQGLGGKPAKGQPTSIYDDPLWGYKANRHVLAFVAGMRAEESRGTVEAESPATTSTATLEASVIDGLGHPVQDVMVELYELPPGGGSRVIVADAARTDDMGKALFEDLNPAAWYRAESQTDDGQIGRSTVFQVRNNQTLQLRPIVVRPPDQQLSGFVLRSQSPADSAKVELLDPDGNPVLSTMTDAQGFFVLGPVNPGDLTLRISHYDPSPVVLTLPVPADRELPEVVVPLDALAQGRTTPRPAGQE